MTYLILLTTVLKWLLICLTCISTSSLVWRILRRKSIHTIFNLGWCFYFIIAGVIYPFMITEYITLIQHMILHTSNPSPASCQALFLFRSLAIQISKASAQD